MQYIDINKHKPQCNMREFSTGVEVFVKPYGEETAYYGRRLGGLPCFYKYNKKLTGITHFAPLKSALDDNDDDFKIGKF